jgi:hypothetical protein
MWLEDLPREALNQAPIDWSTDMPPEDGGYEEQDLPEEAAPGPGKAPNGKAPAGKTPAKAPALGGKAGAPPKAGAKP